jgi:hypothetical protein
LHSGYTLLRRDPSRIGKRKKWSRAPTEESKFTM